MKKFILNPWYLIFIYIGFVFAFAIVYNSFFSGQFYHNTIKYEKEFYKLKNNVLEDIKSSIVRNFEHHHHSTTLEIKRKYLPAYLHIDKIQLDNLSVNDGSISFNGHFLYSDLFHVGPGKGRPVTYKYFFSLSESPMTVRKPMFSGETRELFILSNEDNPIDEKYLVPKEAFEPNPSIFLTNNEIKRLETLFEYNNGIVKKNSFVRMLYFSAVTISTIGYGDIVPIDDTLRVIVGIEAILGIIFIGLFINALGDKLRGKGKEPTQCPT